MRFFILTIVLCILTGCGCTNQTARMVQVKKDSAFIRNIYYDSISIYREHEREYRRAALPIAEMGQPIPPDTIVISDVSIEYRYRLLRDTICIVQYDSIPYPVKGIEVHEVKTVPWWSKGLSLIGAISLVLIFIKFFTY